MSTLVEDTTDSPSRDGSDLPAPVRWMLAFPGSPLWLAAGVALLYLVVGIAAVGVEWAPIGVWDQITYALFFGWVPLALVVLVRGTGRDAVDLAPALGLDAASLRASAFAAGIRTLPWSMPLGLVQAGIDLLLMAELGPLLEQSSAAVTFFAMREVLLSLALFAVLGWAAGAAWSLSRQTRAHARPDLLNARPLAPLARCGTRMLLFWVLMISLNFPVLFLGSAEVLRVLGVMVLVLFALAIAALAIPTWGARQALRATKAAELDRVQQEIRDAREARDDSRLPGLLAWEARIASVSEWPIDAGSFRLTGLYLLIPLLSWVGGALVERVVDALVG